MRPELHTLVPLIFGKTYQNLLLGTQSANLVGVWPFSDASGGICKNIKVTEVTGSIVTNGDFETASGGGEVFAEWTGRVGTGAIDSEAVVVHGGAASLKLTRGADNNTWVYQYMRVEPGETYTISFWTHANGGNPTRYGIKNFTAGTWITALATSTGESAAAWAEFTDTFVAPAGCSVIMLYLQTPEGAGELCYWDDISISGLQTLNGGYAESGVTLGEPGIGDGKTSAGLSTASVLMGSPTFAANIDTAEGSAIAWGKVDAAGRWTDGAAYRYLFHPKSYISPHHYIVFGKNDQNHELIWRRKAGIGLNTNEKKYTFAVAGTLNWFCMGYSWSISTPLLRGYLYVPGEVAWHQVFTTAGINMDDFGVNTMSGIGACYAAGGYPNGQDWTGWEAYVALWGGAMLSELEMRKVMTGP